MYKSLLSAMYRYALCNDHDKNTSSSLAFHADYIF